MEQSRTPLLDRVTEASALRELSVEVLPELAREIREVLVEKVCASGGHLGVNLGVVELTIALHRLFESPRDVLLFDTGHQTYVHKLLTGRRGGFDRLRTRGGLSGYASRGESVHDWVENSHASTALAYADGLAKALKLTKQSGTVGAEASRARRIVAVIGDGALTGGLAWEGLNNLGARPEGSVIVVLNDNGRSYAPTVGGIARHLELLRARPRPMLTSPEGLCTNAPNVFEQLGLAYLGPVDGHDLPALESALRTAADCGRSTVVHVVTKKGRGYPPAEMDEADHMHGIGVLDPVTGLPLKPPLLSWTDLFGSALSQLADSRDDVVAVSAAMLGPVGLGEFARRHPSRVFDVGIAEGAAVCSAAGLALGGMHPVVCLYATFLNRAFDQVLMDVALHRLPVTFVLDRAGITGPDGPSHHGMWDIGLLGMVPGLRLAAPRDAPRLRELLAECLEVSDCPTAIRFPKAQVGREVAALSRMNGIDVLYRSAHLPLEVLIVAQGAVASECIAAAELLTAERIGVTVIDPRWILPVQDQVIHLAARHSLVVTVEDGSVEAGSGAALAHACAVREVATTVRTLGLPKHFIEHGGRRELLDSNGICPAGIAEYIARHARSAYGPTRVTASDHLTKRP